MNSSAITTKNRRIIALAVILILLFTALEGPASADTAALTASAKVTATAGANIRSKASTKGASKGVAKYNKGVTVTREYFSSKTSTKKKNRWYKVTTGDKTGYIRADLLGGFTYHEMTVVTTAKVNYRAGAGSKMKKKGTFKKGTQLTAVLKAKPKGDSTLWYKVRKGSGFVYVSGKYIKEVGDAQTAQTAQPASSTVAASAVGVDLTKPLEITTSGVTYPTALVTRIPFGLKGTVSANRIIDSAVVGVLKSNGDYAIKKELDVGSTVFNI